MLAAWHLEFLSADREKTTNADLQVVWRVRSSDAPGTDVYTLGRRRQAQHYTDAHLPCGRLCTCVRKEVLNQSTLAACDCLGAVKRTGMCSLSLSS